MEILVVCWWRYNSHDVKLFFVEEYLHHLGITIFDGKKQHVPERPRLNLLADEGFFLLLFRVLFCLVVIKIDLDVLERIEVEMF